MKTITDMCEIASSKPIHTWPMEIMKPLPKCPEIGIFGHNHRTMGRDRTMDILEALIYTGLCESKNTAREAIKRNSVLLNGVRLIDSKRVLSSNDALININSIVLEVGRRNYGIIEMCD